LSLPRFLSGIGWIVAGSWLWGILAIAAGIVILIIPRILNYVVGVYLIILGLGQIFASGWALFPLIVGALTLLFGIIVMVNPGVLNALVAIIFIIQGIMLLTQYYHWF